jgi:hypothetical protein
MPGVAAEEEEMVSVVEPVPATVDGLNEEVVPEGSPPTLNETLGLGSVPGITLMVKLVLLPARRAADVDGERIRKGCRDVASPPCERLSYTMM